MITVAIEVSGGVAYIVGATSKDSKEVGEHLIVQMTDHDNEETSTQYVKITNET